MIQTVKKIHDTRTDSVDENYLMLYYSDGTEWCVPKNEDNRHYREIQKWVAEGNTIEEAD